LSSTIGGFDLQTDIFLGGRVDKNGDRHFHGQIALLTVFTGDVTPQQVATLFQGGEEELENAAPWVPPFVPAPEPTPEPAPGPPPKGPPTPPPEPAPEPTPCTAGDGRAPGTVACDPAHGTPGGSAETSCTCGCGDAYTGDDCSTPPPMDVAETLQAMPEFSSLVAAAAGAGLVPALQLPGPFTIFAPSNAAFTQWGNTDDLASVLTYHISNDELFANELTDGILIPTINGATIAVSIDVWGDDGARYVVLNGVSRVVQADIQATNGVIHMIDTVLTVPEPELNILQFLAEDPRFSSLVTAAAAEDGELAEVLAGPTCEQGADCLGQTQTDCGTMCPAVCGEPMTMMCNMMCFQGYQCAGGLFWDEGVGCVAEDACATSTHGLITVFAPTNAAFDALGDLSSTAVKYHIVHGAYYSTDLSDGMVLETLHGESIVVSVVDNQVQDTANL
jgi:uncharacterized surface protein with fasciclin (FAS1) repeats